MSEVLTSPSKLCGPPDRAALQTHMATGTPIFILELVGSSSGSLSTALSGMQSYPDFGAGWRLLWPLEGPILLFGLGIGGVGG